MCLETFCAELLICSRYLIALGFCAAFLVYGTKAGIQNSPGFSFFWNLGLGTVNPDTTIFWGAYEGPKGLIQNALLANVPQIILSFIYFTYNGLFTAMLLSREWNDFSRERKGIRVSGVPRGHQRSSYFLHLPYRYSFPLMALSALLHWLVSQSIFLVVINGYPTDSPNILDQSYITCGYSPAAMLLVIIVGILMMAYILVFGSLRFKSGIPVASSCSLAIAAACHPGSENRDVDISESKLQWGVIDLPVGNGFGHCGFTDKPVSMPIEGPMYA